MADTMQAATVPFPSAEANKCPFGFYDQLRASCPVRPVPEQNQVQLFRHEDVSWVLQNEDKFTIYEPGSPSSVGLDYGGAIHLAGLDGEEHRRERKLLSRPFTPGRLKGYVPMIEGHVEMLIDRFVDRGQVALIEEFGNPLPALVIASLMELPTTGETFDFLQRWNDNFTKPLEVRDAAELEEMFERMVGWMDERRADPATTSSPRPSGCRPSATAATTRGCA